jgi:hypothetical protein
MPNARGEPLPRAGARDDVTTVAMASTGVYWIPLILIEAPSSAYRRDMLRAA